MHVSGIREAGASGTPDGDLCCEEGRQMSDLASGEMRSAEMAGRATK